MPSHMGEAIALGSANLPGPGIQAAGAQVALHGDIDGEAAGHGADEEVAGQQHDRVHDALLVEREAVKLREVIALQQVPLAHHLHVRELCRRRSHELLRFCCVACREVRRPEVVVVVLSLFFTPPFVASF